MILQPFFVSIIGLIILCRTALAINDPSTDNAKMDCLIDLVANGLFAVCVTLGVVPIIKCPRNNAAEQIAKVINYAMI